MLKRLLALVILIGLVGAGLYVWRSGGVRPSLGQVSRQLDDVKLTGSVKTALALNRRLQAADISVSSEDGVVTLRGTAPGADAKARALEIAGGVPGVRQVVDHLRLAPQAPAEAETEVRTLGESLDDQTVMAEVRLALSLDRELAGQGIQVEVFRREVTLAGELTAAGQRRRALAIAADVRGVRSVVDHLHVREVVRVRALDAERVLAANPNLAGYRLRVREEGESLVISGRVRTGAEKELAGLLVREAAGQPVTNSVTLGAGSKPASTR